MRLRFRAMRVDVDENAVRTLAREIVAAVSPAELRMFSLQTDEYFEDPPDDQAPGRHRGPKAAA